MDWKTELRKALANCTSVEEVEAILIVKSGEGDVCERKIGFYACDAEKKLKKISGDQNCAFGFTGTLVSVTVLGVTTEINLPLSL